MKITDKHPFIRLDTYIKNIREMKRLGETDQTGASNSTREDQVVLSPTSRAIQEAKKLLETVPDIREDRVAQIKAQIQNGTYTVDAQKVAAKIIEESLLNDLL